MASRILRSTSFFLIYLSVALFIFSRWLFIDSLGFNSNPECDLSYWIDGAAIRPFAYRVLLPWVVGFFTNVLPVSFQVSVVEHCPLLVDLSRYFYVRSVDHAFALGLVLFFNFFSLVAFFLYVSLVVS